MNKVLRVAALASLLAMFATPVPDDTGLCLRQPLRRRAAGGIIAARLVHCSEPGFRFLV